jgi:hypothetical protein
MNVPLLDLKAQHSRSNRSSILRSPVSRLAGNSWKARDREFENAFAESCEAR